MKAAQVHAVIAGGVSDPRRLVRWSDDPQSLQALDIDPASLDTRALRGFAGLALKVRHNGLRDALSCTFRLLNLAELEIRIFSDYAIALAAAGTPLAGSNEGRAAGLVDFLRDWHDPQQPTHALLWDLIRHEQALMDLNRPISLPDAPQRTLQPTLGSIPQADAHLRLHEMRFDPFIIAHALRQREPDLDTIDAAPRLLCYQATAGETSIRVMELDAFAFGVLQAADGQRTLAEVLSALGLGKRLTVAISRMLTQLAQIGLLSFSRRDQSTR